MKITTFQTVIMAIFAVLAIVGIFVFATYSGGAKSTVGSVTVWGTFPESDVSKAITALGAGNVDFKNVTYVQKQEETFDSDYINSVAEGSGPDLILISQEDLMRLKNTIYPIPYSSITQRQFSDSFADASAIFAQPDGIYGMPALIDPLVMYYNKTLLTSAGIAAPPSTWEAITGLIPKVTALTNSQAVTRALIAMGTYGNVHNARGILSALFFQAGVPISVLTSKGAQGSLGSDASTNGVSLGAAALRFYTSFANPAQSSYTWNSSLPDSQQFFLSGKLALYMGYASENAYIKEANPNLDYDVANLPQPATAQTRVTYGKIYAFSIPKSAKNKAGAFSIAVAFSADAAQSGLVSAIGSVAPAKKTLLGAATSDPDATVFYDQAIIAKGWLSPAPTVTDGIFASMIQAVISGRLAADQAINSAEASLTAALTQ